MDQLSSLHFSRWKYEDRIFHASIEYIHFEYCVVIGLSTGSLYNKMVTKYMNTYMIMDLESTNTHKTI